MFDKLSAIAINWTLRNRWAVSLKFHFTLFFVIFILLLILGLVLLHYDPNPEPLTCLSNVVLEIMVVEFLISGGFILFGIIQLWRVRDPYFYKIELKLILFTGGVIFPLWVMSLFIEAFPPIIRARVWVFLSLFCNYFVSIIMPLVKSYSIEKSKNRERLLEETNGDLLFNIWSDPVLLASFEK